MPRAVLWFMLIMALGNFAMAGYLLLQLRRWQPASGIGGAPSGRPFTIDELDVAERGRQAGVSPLDAARDSAAVRHRHFVAHPDAAGEGGGRRRFVDHERDHPDGCGGVNVPEGAQVLVSRGDALGEQAREIPF